MNFAEAIFCALRKENILIVAVQVPVYDVTQRVISFVDAIGFDARRGVVVVLEIKTGYDYAYQYAERKMLPLLEHVPCSLRNMHQLQLAWYFNQCSRSYGLQGSIHSRDAMLLRVNAKNTRVKPIIAKDSSLVTKTRDWYNLAKWTEKSMPHIRATLAKASE